MNTVAAPRATKGFTLIELLIVIAIVAALAVAVVLVLNPVQLLRQARDATRVSDLGTLRSAVGLYLADVSSTILSPDAVTCFASKASPGAQCGGRFSITYSNVSGTTSQRVDGSGWMPINLTTLNTGSPVGNLPLDPVNSGVYYYAYAANTTNFTFEINAKLESLKYSNNGGFDLESTDGGNDVNLFEVGNDPLLDL
jgi:prepilin-type N-terminal cleavage/methylation domain-containing protein